MVLKKFNALNGSWIKVEIREIWLKMWKMGKVEFEIDMWFSTRLPPIEVGLFNLELSFQISNKAPPSFPTSNLRPYKHQLTSKSNKLWCAKYP